MKSISSLKAFSLIELLVALCILTIVATVAIPLFSNLQSEAQTATAGEMTSELNNTYANWKASGGQPPDGVSVWGSDVLMVLGSAPGTNVTSNSVTDAGTSNGYRVSLPSGTILSSANPQSNVVMSTDYIITYDSGTEQFTVTPIGQAAIIALSGTYNGVTSNEIDFGNNAPTPATGTLTIQNTGSQPLAIISVSFIADNWSGTWSGTIPPGGSQAVTITNSGGKISMDGWATVNVSGIYGGTNTIYARCGRGPVP
jgi:prepilin-type N-terminal cleavage/methylation domain-containing protein